MQTSTIAKIKKEILEMYETDQSARSEDRLDWNRIQRIDKENAKRMKKIIKEYGWITINRFGKKTSKAAWLLVQHADHSPKFQRKCLDLMLEQPEGEVRPIDIAMLTDRVLMKEKGIQKYGTQMIGHGEYLVMGKVEDLENLDKLRAKVGLKPIKEYAKKFSRPVFLTEEELKEYLKSHLEANDQKSQ